MRRTKLQGLIGFPEAHVSNVPGKKINGQFHSLKKVLKKKKRRRSYQGSPGAEFNHPANVRQSVLLLLLFISVLFFYFSFFVITQLWSWSPLKNKIHGCKIPDLSFSFNSDICHADTLTMRKVSWRLWPHSPFARMWRKCEAFSFGIIRLPCLQTQASDNVCRIYLVIVFCVTFSSVIYL